MTYAKNILLATLLSLPLNCLAESRSYLGLNLGFDNLLADQMGESNKNGFDFGMKLVKSLDLGTFFLDPGIGYQYEEISSDHIIIKTSTPFIELSSRYKFNNYWSFGPLIQGQFLSDNSRAESSGMPNFAIIAGGHLVHEIMLGDYPARFELIADRSISGLKNRELYSVKFGIQFSFNKGSSFANEKTYVCSQDKLIKPIIVENKKEITSFIQSIVYGFNTNKSELSLDSKIKIKKIADFIIQNNIKMDKITITGYSDQRGSEEHNYDLSEKRAIVIKTFFEKEGIVIPIDIKGLGSTFLIDQDQNDNAYSKNRRAEIQFFNVNSELKLVEEFSNITK